MVTHQLQVKHRTAKARRPKTDVLPLDHATNHNSQGPWCFHELPAKSLAFAESIRVIGCRSETAVELIGGGFGATSYTNEGEIWREAVNVGLLLHSKFTFIGAGVGHGTIKL